jgi:hypothetical protein
MREQREERSVYVAYSPSQSVTYLRVDHRSLLCSEEVKAKRVSKQRRACGSPIGIFPLLEEQLQSSVRVRRGSVAI